MTELLAVLGGALVIAGAVLLGGRGTGRSVGGSGRGTLVTPGAPRQAAEVGAVASPAAPRQAGRVVASPVPSAETPRPLPFDERVFEPAAKREGLDWRLLKAIALVESGLDPEAENPADPSYGLMQIHCPHGSDGRCRNRLPALEARGLWPVHVDELLDPVHNARIGAAILAANLRSFNGDLVRAIAGYNHWSGARDWTGGTFPNERYVQRVLDAYAELGGPKLERGA